MTDSTDAAIRLREEGRDEEARAMLLRLLAEDPLDPVINYQCGWVHDKLGLEREAVSYYLAAIEGGLGGSDLRGALLGLGSTYRSIGEYEKAAEVLRLGISRFPEAEEFPVFLAMALYNLGEHREAMALLLESLASSSSSEGISRFRDAIRFYAEDLDQTW